MRILLLLLASTFLFSGAVVHEFHVSKLIINHNTARGTFEITFETFIDDLEAVLPAMSKEGGLAKVTTEELDLTTSTEHPSANALLHAYLSEKIKLADASDTPLSPTYLGKEAADDPYAIYVYLSLPATGPTLSSISLTSSFLCELYEDQQNIVVWKQDKKILDTDLLTCSSRKSSYKK